MVGNGVTTGLVEGMTREAVAAAILEVPGPVLHPNLALVEAKMEAATTAIVMGVTTVIVETGIHIIVIVVEITRETGVTITPTGPGGRQCPKNLWDPEMVNQMQRRQWEGLLLRTFWL